MPQYPLWLSRRQANWLLVGVPTDLDAPHLAPETLIRGLRTIMYFVLARQQRRFRVDAALAVNPSAETTRMSIAALREGRRAIVADCGLTKRGSATGMTIGEPWDRYDGVVQPLELPAGVLECRASWVCERCWSEVPSGYGSVTSARAGLEIARLLLELACWWSGRRGHHEPLAHMKPRRRRWWELVVGRNDQVEFHGVDEFPIDRRGWRPSVKVQRQDAYAEITTAAGTRRVPLPFGARIIPRDDDEREPLVVVATTKDPCVEIEACAHPSEPGWPWTAKVSEHSTRFHYGVPCEGYSELFDRFERNDWRVLLCRGLGPVEELSPFAGRLRIDRLADGLFDLHVEAPADEHGPARAWTQRRAWLNPEIMWAADGDPVQAGQRLIGGHLDLSARAAIEPEWTRGWLLELLVSLTHTGGANVDWRALELYARLATTPRDRYRTLAELARDHADPITRMRTGSLFEELRAAVLSPATALRDPISLALAAKRSAL